MIHGSLLPRIWIMRERKGVGRGEWNNIELGAANGLVLYFHFGNKLLRIKDRRAEKRIEETGQASSSKMNEEDPLARIVRYGTDEINIRALFIGQHGAAHAPAAIRRDWYLYAAWYIPFLLIPLLCLPFPALAFIANSIGRVASGRNRMFGRDQTREASAADKSCSILLNATTAGRQRNAPCW